MRMMIGAPIMAVGGIIMAMSKDKPLTVVLKNDECKICW